ncbi:unnamed protein product [Spirodela intermedia]|uniref:Uncharacterized protein n=1 Tax=Spirodela intermedia TaxID=51605 RepID=A0ABN7EBD2_SPIIN|nr:unnamed protein product [Spirodela intermedia]
MSTYILIKWFCRTKISNYLTLFGTLLIEMNAYDIDYIEMFSLVVSIQLYSSDTLSKQVFMKQSLEYVDQEESSKQKVISCSNAEFEYRAMVEIAQVMMWLSSLLKGLDVFSKSLVMISYDLTCTKLGIFDLYAPT